MHNVRMTRAILALLVLAGCSTDRIPVDRENVSAHELTDIPWPWCTADQLLKCPYIRQGGEMFMLQPGLVKTAGRGSQDVGGFVQE